MPILYNRLNLEKEGQCVEKAILRIHKIACRAFEYRADWACSYGYNV
jgi:hypothetical protein